MKNRLINNILTMMLSVMAVVTTASCDDSQERDLDPGTPSTGEQPGPSQRPGDETRTVLVYMVANNSLGRYNCDDVDLVEMETAAELIPDGSRWVVYHLASDDSAPVLKELTADGWKVLKTYDRSTSSVSAARMTDVISDVKRMAPSDTYGLVLWSHAHGWLQNGIEEPVIAPRSYGDDGGQRMNITTLAHVLDGCGFDYIYADCCYMATVEVAYELRDVARYFVASPSEVPINGMPYDQNLPLLLKGDTESLIAAATNTYNYYDALTGSNRTCTMSVVDLSVMTELSEATAAIYGDDAVSYDSNYQPQKYMTETRCYYYDLADYVGNHQGVSPDKAARWQAALDKAVLYEAATPYLWNRVEIVSHCGLSTYVLEGSGSPTTMNYNTLSWWRDVASLKVE